jgi:hypothetical protein
MTFIPTESRRKFLASDEALWAREQLQLLVDNTQYNTPEKASYAHPETQPLSFVEWNLMYLTEHPQIRVSDYISNVRLRTRLRVAR